MKNIVLSAVAVAAMSSFAVAGGDIAPVEEPIVVVEEVMPSTGSFYLGLAYGFMNAEIDDTTYPRGGVLTETVLDEDFSAIMINAGYDFNQYVGIEGRYWFGGNDTIGTIIDSAGVPRDVDADIDTWGIYVKPMYPVSDAFDIYALLGYADNGYELSAITVKGDVELNSDADIDGFSWGIGAAYSFTDNMSVFVDYTVLYDDETEWAADLVVEDVIDTINFGVTYQF